MDMKHYLTLIPVLGLFFLASCSNCEYCNPDVEAIKAEIQGIENTFADAISKRDAEFLVSYYADDAVNMPPDNPPVVGKEAILERTKGWLENAEELPNMKFEVVDLFAAGNYAIEIGKFSEDEVEKGKYISIFEKRDGKYVCIRDIYNNNSAEDEETHDHEHDHDGEEHAHEHDHDGEDHSHDHK